MAKTYKSGKIRGEKVKYPDGIGYAIWQLLKDSKDEDDEGTGLCFDFPDYELEDILKIITEMKDAEPDIYEHDPDYEESQRKRKETEKKWWKKLHKSVEDIGIQLTPFDWNFHRFLVSKKVPLGKEYGYQVCKGFYFGPFCVTW